jgi:CMP-2-keto-3-deoxyoctulosonic acid synthetase
MISLELAASLRPNLVRVRNAQRGLGGAEACGSIAPRPNVVFNVQNDHPGIDPEHFNDVIPLAASSSTDQVSALCTPIRLMV